MKKQLADKNTLIKTYMLKSCKIEINNLKININSNKMNTFANKIYKDS